MPDISSDTGFIERVSNEYYNLTATEKKAADYVIAHRSQSQSMSITELALACGVAEATLSRLARRLQYKGYNEFRTAVARSVMTYSPELSPLAGEVTEGEPFPDMIRKIAAADVEAIAQTVELVDEESMLRAADTIQAAEKVFCMGQGGSMIIAEEAAHLFGTTECKYFAVTDSHRQAMTAAMMTEKDAILYFSYSGATKDMIHTLSLARQRGAKVVLITRYPSSPGAALADVTLRCGANESPLQLGSVAARLSQLYLMDVLFSTLCLRNLETCRDSRNRIADALSEKHL